MAHSYTTLWVLCGMLQDDTIRIIANLGRYVLNDTKHLYFVPQLNVIFYPLYSMNTFVTNKSKLPQDGAQVFPYMG